MTLAELFEEQGRKEGVQQGRKEGIQKGRQEGIQVLANTAIKLITKYIESVPENMADQIKQQDIPILEAIIENVLEMQTLDDVKKHLK